MEIYMKAAVDLTSIRAGESCTFYECRCKRNTRLFLESLGFFPGIPVKIAGRSGGDLIVEILGTRLAMSGDLAKDLHVLKRQSDGRSEGTQRNRSASRKKIRVYNE